MLNKYNALCGEFVGSKLNALSGVLVNDSVTVGTDAYTLLEVTKPVTDLKDLPSIDGLEAVEDATEIIPAVAIKSIGSKLKSSKRPKSLPILSNAWRTAIGYAVTDLTSFEQVTYSPVQGDFPDYKRIFPTDKPLVELTLNPEYLLRIAKAYKEANVSQVKLTIYAELLPVKFTATIEETKQVMTALVMPIKA